MKEMQRYIEVVSYETGEVIHRVDVTGRSERQIDQIDRGMQHNLDHTRFYTRTPPTETLTLEDDDD